MTPEQKAEAAARIAACAGDGLLAIHLLLQRCAHLEAQVGLLSRAWAHSALAAMEAP